MNNKKSTKRTLLGSVLSLLLCMAMLIGTTFAWFTDNATTGVNTIQSGKLDIVLEMKGADGKWVDAEGKTLDFKKATGAENEAILWEPGCTYELPALRVRNNGNLALKYQLVVNGVNGDAKLLEAIEFTANDDALTTFSGKLLTKDAVSDEILIKGHMKEEADNEYQGLTISGINITVFATQVDYEHDSYGNQYDVKASEEAVFITAGGDKTIAEALAEGAKEIYIAGEHEFTAAQAGSSTDMKGVSIIGVTDDATIVVNGTGGGLANVNLKDLKVVDETAYAYENGENAWEFTYLELEGTSTYTNVAFEDGVLVDGVSSIFTDCSFSGHNNDSSNKGDTTMYGAWVYSGSASFTNCNFSGTRGLKVADQYSGSDVTDVVVDNCFFGPLSEKPGVAVDNRLGSLELVIKNSTFAGTQAGDAEADTTKGVPYIYENDNHTPDTTTITLENNTVENNAKFVSTPKEVAEVLGGKKTGTYYLGGDVDMKNEVVTTTDAGRGNSLTLDGNGYTLSNINVATGGQNGMSNVGLFYNYSGSTLTIKNLVLEGITATDPEGVKTYGTAVLVGYNEGNLNIENVTIKDSTVTGRKAGVFVGYTTGDVTITNCTATGCVVGASQNGGAYIGHLDGANATITNSTNDAVGANGAALPEIGRQ